MDPDILSTTRRFSSISFYHSPKVAMAPPLIRVAMPAPPLVAAAMAAPALSSSQTIGPAMTRTASSPPAMFAPPTHSRFESKWSDSGIYCLNIARLCDP